MTNQRLGLEDELGESAPRPDQQCDGRCLREMFLAGTAVLEYNAEAINALNVFPVPDGDTGTNMLLTMKSSMTEAVRSADHSAAAVSQAMAHGALMGARGNSGVIMSQILRGLAQGLENRGSFSGVDLAAALAEATRSAYKGVGQPVEGTILTVIREAAEAAQAATRTGKVELIEVMEVAVEAASEAVIKTPDLLAVLKESGVVDAGGQALYLLLEGALRSLRGEALESAPILQGIVTAQPKPILQPAEEVIYGYCTEFLLKGKQLGLEEVREKITSMGESVMVVGDGDTIRVHVHTLDPGSVISYATSLGTIQQVKIDNMDEQHLRTTAKALPTLGNISVVAVAPGDGLIEVFKSLGSSAVVHGGHGMNPSINELLDAVNRAPYDNVVILPNNKNIIPAAKQIRALTGKKVFVVPTTTVPQGIAALMAFNFEADLETNLASMEKATGSIRTAEITTAIRSTQLKGVAVKKGQAIALIDGELAVASDNMEEALEQALAKTVSDDAEVITLYYGSNVDQLEAERITAAIREKWPEQEVDLIYGGQNYYHFIVSVE